MTQRNEFDEGCKQQYIENYMRPVIVIKMFLTKMNEKN